MNISNYNNIKRNTIKVQLLALKYYTKLPEISSSIQNVFTNFEYVYIHKVCMVFHYNFVYLWMLCVLQTVTLVSLAKYTFFLYQTNLFPTQIEGYLSEC